MKRFISLTLILLIAISSLTAVNITASAATITSETTGTVTFTPRTTAPSTNNANEYRYYYDDENPFNATRTYGLINNGSNSGIGNCTAYAYGRAFEILGYDPNLPTCGADGWYNSCTNYEKGKQPKLGAVACWTNHVAIVEEIHENYIVVSESAWGQYLFNTAISYKNNNGYTYGTGRQFYGFIYIIDNAEQTPTPEPSDTNYETGTYITTDYMNMRQQASITGSYLTTTHPETKLTITEIVKNNDYVWGKTTYNNITGWIAIATADNNITYLKKIETTPKTTPTVPTEPVTVPSTTESVTEPVTIPSTTESVTIPEKYENTIIIGDVNLDGYITVSDITELQRFLAEFITIEYPKNIAADVDNTGDIQIDDATTIQQYLAKLIEPNETQIGKTIHIDTNPKHADSEEKYTAGKYRTLYYVNLRKTTDTNSKSLTVINNNTILNIESVIKTNGYFWGKTTYNNMTGYVAITDINENEILTEPYKQETQTDTNENFMFEIKEPDNEYHGVKIKLTKDEREELARIVEGEFGEDSTGSKLIAQALRDAIVYENCTPLTVRKNMQYAGYNQNPSKNAYDAVDYIFAGNSVVQHKILCMSFNEPDQNDWYLPITKVIQYKGIWFFTY
ncbi:MAG: CHAP domain-containing protein [Ruminococcus bromii]|nr:CHAP domain-containing protein [Ruminococcus bromii]